MKQTIGIIDYGFAGNIFSIKKSLDNLGKEIHTKVVSNSDDLDSVDKIVLPGVGAYRDAMEGISVITESVKKFAETKPVLGICLGMQILSKRGYEYGETKGLGILEGEVMELAVKARIPHLGWAKVDAVKSSKILEGITTKDNFYFMHSYEFINYKDVVGLTVYGDHQFVSVVEKDNVTGVQFHPEKSRESGLRVFKNFSNI